MATVSIVNAPVSVIKGVGVLLDATDSILSEAITSTGASQQSVMTALADNIWVISAVGGNVWVRFGANPTAASGDDWLICAGQTREFQGKAGHKVAVVDAA